MKYSFSRNNYIQYGFLAMLGFVMIPSIAFAAPQSIINLVTLVETIIQALFPIAVAVAVLTFGYNIAKYLTSKNLADQNVYKAGILNSALALFIIFVFLGVITVLANSLGIGSLGGNIGVSDPSGVAAGSGGVSTFRNIALSVAGFISKRVIPIMVACAMLFFIGNIIISMSKSDVEAERTKLNQYMKWGIIALFLLLTLFSVVGMFTGSLFGTGAIIPQFQTK
jgi:hypothetical protein